MRRGLDRQAARRRRSIRVRRTYAGALGDVLPGVLVDPSTDVLEFVPALRVTGPFGRARMAEPSGDLDDDAGVVEEEIDTGDLPPVLPVDDLRPRPRQSCFADQLQEAALEHRVPARSRRRGRRSVDIPTVRIRAASRDASAMTSGDESPSRTALSIAASIRRGCARACARSMIVRVADIARNPVDLDEIDRLQSGGGVHGERQRVVPTVPIDRELHRLRLRSIEAVQRRPRPRSSPNSVRRGSAAPAAVGTGAVAGTPRIAYTRGATRRSHPLVTSCRRCQPCEIRARRIWAALNSPSCCRAIETSSSCIPRTWVIARRHPENPRLRQRKCAPERANLASQTWIDGLRSVRWAGGMPVIS